MTLPEQSDMEIWECPTCGTQFAIGRGTAVLGAPLKCNSYGHEPVECEQKLVQAFPFTAKELGGQ
jgi:hypothetical protein